MNCQVCGELLSPDVRFCSRCGAAAVPGQGPSVSASVSGVRPGAAPYAYGVAPVALVRPPRVAQHVRTLGILWVCFGVWRVLGGLFGMFFLSALTTHRFARWGFPLPFDGRSFPPAWMGFMVPVIAVSVIVAAALAFGTGYGLLNRTSWGRILAIIAAVLALLKFPLGTALGIYTLWVLAPRESGAEYEHLTAVGGS